MRPISYEGNENYIFISYAHKDTETVFQVLELFQRNHYRFWYDEGITPGSEWPEDIARHLNASAMVIAFITPNAMASPNCRREINYALSKNKPFLSVLLEPTEMPPGMEMQLSAQQSILRHNFPEWEGFCRKLLSTPDLARCRYAEVPAAQPVSPAEPVIPAQPVIPAAQPVIPAQPVVPAQPAVQTAQPVIPAAQPVIPAASGTAPRAWTAGAAPAAPGWTSGKSKLPWILGGVGALVAVIALVLVLVLTGGSNDAGSAVTPINNNNPALSVGTESSQSSIIPQITDAPQITGAPVITVPPAIETSVTDADLVGLFQFSDFSDAWYQEVYELLSEDEDMDLSLSEFRIAIKDGMVEDSYLANRSEDIYQLRFAADYKLTMTVQDGYKPLSYDGGWTIVTGSKLRLVISGSVYDAEYSGGKLTMKIPAAGTSSWLNPFEGDFDVELVFKK